MKRKPIQILELPDNGVGYNPIMCLCDDGTIWLRDRPITGMWEKIEDLPQPEAQPTPATKTEALIRDAITVLRDIIRDLPARRDWLDPDIEFQARCVLKGAYDVGQ